VVGRSNIVGLPASMLLQNRDATVTVVHSRTPDGDKICAGAINGTDEFLFVRELAICQN
jgi:5,10-methylene-tetrahydrofolate dehydrogenase/methenyl tetrahydrofolate cyclohydrolase